MRLPVNRATYRERGKQLEKGKLPNFDNKIKLTHLIIACLAVAIVTAILTYVAAIGGFGSKQYLDDARRYIEIEKIIDDNYIGDADYNELYNAAAAAMVKSIGDKWSYFMNAEEYEAYKLSSSNEYSGIGVSVKVNSSGEFEVFSVEESSPAANAGIAVGDIITAIDGEDVSDKTLEDVSLLIRSKVNKDFPMTLESGGDTKTVTVACEIIYKNPVSSRLLDGNIGYIKISNFEAGSSENTKRQLSSFCRPVRPRLSSMSVITPAVCSPSLSICSTTSCPKVICSSASIRAEKKLCRPQTRSALKTR